LEPGSPWKCTAKGEAKEEMPKDKFKLTGKTSHSKGGQTLRQGPREGGQSPPLEILKSQPDVAPRSPIRLQI